MTYSFQPEAEQELIKAIAYYEDHQEGLGVSFSEEVFSTIDQILLFPKAWAAFGRGYRRILLSDFPFSIVYKLDEAEDKCMIYAVMHLHRKSDYWKHHK